MKHRLTAESAAPALGMGCWAIGGPFWSGDKPFGWGSVDDAESTAAIRRALELGVTVFDTADVYGAGHSERVLGSALAGHRDEVLIATKWGNVFDETSRRIVGRDTTPGYLRPALEASLRRLGTDHVDLYQLHVGDVESGVAQDLVGTLEELVAEGKIRFYGWSTDKPSLPDAMAGPRFAAVQHELNVLRDAPEMLSLTGRNGWTSVCRGPLAMGMLSPKYTSGTRLSREDVRGDKPEWVAYFQDGRPDQSWLDRRDAVRDILTSGGRSLVQGALAWIWARAPQCLPIPGFRTAAQVEENAGALAHGALSPADLREIDRILARTTPLSASSAETPTLKAP
ncbi:aldo/keto reductase [Streptomyces sp. NPDC086549]|uniref:aldo/keto reductase n=1 Tax=Streptomyces sp. NPDC086549 TaxID=3365752 RepID=UPI003813A132